jgi:Ca2+-dependent lipid-binding protein
MNHNTQLHDVTVKKEYLCQVTIIEARNLKSKNKSGLCNPFVKITVADKPSQVTH